MAGFLYFVEHATQQFGDAELDHYGLRYAIESGIRHQSCRAGTSPSGGKGFIVADREAVESCRYLPKEQTWVRKVGDDRVWIGYPTDNLPKLAALQRADLLPGRDVKLSDGSRIHIPIARQWTEIDDQQYWRVALPQALRRNEEGRWVPDQVVARYRQLWDLLTEYIDASEAAIRDADVADGEAVVFSFERINELAIGGIAANYRVADDELEICGVYDQPLRDAVIGVLKDDQTRQDWLKKKVAAWIAAGGSSSAGPEPSTAASTPATPPASSISGAGDRAGIDKSAEVTVG